MDISSSPLQVPPEAPTLPVPDASTEKEFLNHARAVWREKHPERRKMRGGEPWARKVILKAIFQILLKEGRKESLSQGQWMRRVRSILIEERRNKDNLDTPVPSDDAIKDGVKLVRLVLSISLPTDPPSVDEQRWLEKHGSPLIKRHITKIRTTLSAAIDTDGKDAKGCFLPVNARDLEAKGFSNKLAHQSLALLAALDREIRDIFPDFPPDKSVFHSIPG